MKFSYSCGQQPLDGYTIKRGIGRGGFGEVFFAVSEGGKEVALKLLRGGNCDVELRGVAQCLNLKHPNLVGLYDLKKDDLGNRWVVMEYVAGEPLNVVLARHPDGLPRELAREWFLGLARAVGHLHDHGIVHRDLKPANVFLENGTVKVGDYGLSKSMSTSQRTAQTQSVGTVHYMAPEISTGNYNKQIDTYAAGVILYEMLTGNVPFDGESAGEILMKHLTAPPDLARLPAEYVPVVAKALSKNPAQRYASMAEMVRAVEAVGGEPAPAPQRAGPARVLSPAPAAPRPPSPSDPVLTALPAYNTRGQVAELCGAMVLTVVFALMGTALWAALVRTHEAQETAALGNLFFQVVLASWAVLVPAKFWTTRRGNPWARRVVMMVVGAAVGVCAWWLDGGAPAALPAPTADPAAASQSPLLPMRVLTEASQMSFFALAFFALRWWRMTDRRRPRRFSLFPLLAAFVWGMVLGLFLWGGDWPARIPGMGTLTLVLTAAVVQLVSPWEPPPAPAAKRLRLRYA
jgi:hypothetical protein